MRMRSRLDLPGLLRLPGYPHLDQVLGKNIALQQVVVV